MLFLYCFHTCSNFHCCCMRKEVVANGSCDRGVDMKKVLVDGIADRYIDSFLISILSSIPFIQHIQYFYNIFFIFHIFFFNNRFHRYFFLVYAKSLACGIWSKKVKCRKCQRKNVLLRSMLSFWKIGAADVCGWRLAPCLWVISLRCIMAICLSVLQKQLLLHSG